MKKLVSVMMLTLALGAFAFSQAGAGGAGGGGGGRGGQRGGGGGAQFTRAGVQFTLLTHADVQTALKITDDQKTKLDAASAAQRAANQAARDAGGDPASMAAARTKAGQDYGTAVADTLTANQKAQLLGIFVVLAKNMALENPDVQTTLSLTADELTKIKEKVTQAGEANRSLGAKVQDGSMTREDATAARAANTKTLSEGLLAALTSDHQAAFAKMATDAGFTPAEGTNYFGGGGRRPGGGGAAGGGNGG